MRQNRSAVAALLTAVTLLACVPAPKLVSTWTDPTHPPRPYTDLVVFGIAANEKVRDAYEDIFVEALKRHGARARAGHSLIPPGGMANARTLKKAIDLSGPEGVIVTYLRGTDSQAESTLSRPHVTPALDGKLYPYYQRVYDLVTQPGYYATFRLLQLDTSLYDGEREALVWSGRSEAMDLVSERTTTTTINDVIDSTTAALADAGYLPERTTDQSTPGNATLYP